MQLYYCLVALIYYQQIFQNASPYFNDKLAYLNLNQPSKIKNSQNTMLEYILTNSINVDFKSSLLMYFTHQF